MLRLCNLVSLHSSRLPRLMFRLTFFTGLVIPSLLALVGWICLGRSKGGTWWKYFPLPSGASSRSCPESGTGTGERGEPGRDGLPGTLGGVEGLPSDVGEGGKTKVGGGDPKLCGRVLV